MTPICTPANREFGLAIGLPRPPCAHSETGKAAAAILPRSLRERVVPVNMLLPENIWPPKRKRAANILLLLATKVRTIPGRKQEGMVVVVRIRTSFRLKVPRIERLRNSFAAAAFLAVCATSTADMPAAPKPEPPRTDQRADPRIDARADPRIDPRVGRLESLDRKSTRLNSSH